jgi:predicted GIY-YIG superfamily endonuclease
MCVLADMSDPAWMTKAKCLASGFSATTRGERGASHSVYVILLHDPARGGRWGLYVGQTARDPDWRFDQHKAGYKASGAARRFGVRLLPHFTDHLNPMRGWEALEIEAALAAAFRDAGIGWVEGGH